MGVAAPQRCCCRITIVTAQAASSVTSRLHHTTFIAIKEQKPNKEMEERDERRTSVIDINLHFKSISHGTIITADGALAFGIRFGGRGTLFCLLYNAHRLHKLCPILSRRHNGVSELAQFTHSRTSLAMRAGS